MAAVGGGLTLGRGVAEPFPALLEAELGEVCVNLGQPGASVEAFLADGEAMAACRGARAVVLEAVGVGNLSNRLYSVHPRRNDRFLRASPVLRALFPEMDFAEVCFTGHLLRGLREAAPDRFDIVREELRIAWIARMRGFLDLVGPRVVLLWRPEEGGGEPVTVTEGMVEALRPRVAGVVALPGVGMGEDAHRAVAAALVGPVRACLEEARAAVAAS